MDDDWTYRSFLLRKSTNLYNRRHAKILTTLTSYFTSCYVFHWPKYFPDTSMRYPPSFDGRIVVYPDERSIRDYFAWRQADSKRCPDIVFIRDTQLGCSGQRPAHINNMYNTVFWALVQQGGKTTTEAHATLRVEPVISVDPANLTRYQGTVSATKHEILFKEFNINYNDISPRFRKGSVIVRQAVRISLSRSG